MRTPAPTFRVAHAHAHAHNTAINAAAIATELPDGKGGPGAWPRVAEAAAELARVELAGHRFYGPAFWNEDGRPDFETVVSSIARTLAASPSLAPANAVHSCLACFDFEDAFLDFVAPD